LFHVYGEYDLLSTDKSEREMKAPKGQVSGDIHDSHGNSQAKESYPDRPLKRGNLPICVLWVFTATEWKMSRGVRAVQKCVVVTNNPALYRIISAGRLIDGSSLDVLIDVRDAIHLGSRMLTHPLCGNLRPCQQPFRSVLIQNNPEALVHLESLSMIEEAVLLYRSYQNRLLLPCMLSETLCEDYAFVDFELMRESLDRYGLLSRNGALSPDLALR
jgi:hypothetical protein